MSNRDYLRQGLVRLEVDVADEQLEKLQVYCRELQKWSRRINLIAKGQDEQQILEIHFIDGLSLVPLLPADGMGNVHLLDVGSGAGFPGLVLATVFPSHRFTLVEPRKKRVSFLRHIIRTLDLKNVAVHDSRVEDLEPYATGEFSHITGRAVAEPERFLPLIDRLLVPTTRVILMLADREPLERLFDCAPDKYKVIEERPFHLPYSGANRLLVVLTSC